MKTKQDYYDTLGISRDADDASIKRAYRKMAKKYHPDMNQGGSRMLSKNLRKLRKLTMC